MHNAIIALLNYRPIAECWAVHLKEYPKSKHFLTQTQTHTLTLFSNEQSKSNLCVDVCYSRSIWSERVRSCITTSPLSLNIGFFFRSVFSLLHGLTLIHTDTSYHRCGNYNNLTKSIFSIVAHRSSIKSSIFMATCWPEVNFIFRIIDVAISLHIISCL